MVPQCGPQWGPEFKEWPLGPLLELKHCAVIG